MAETGKGVARLAADYLNVTAGELTGLSPEAAAVRANEIRKVAASALRQKEPLGKRLLKAMGII